MSSAQISRDRCRSTIEASGSCPYPADGVSGCESRRGSAATNQAGRDLREGNGICGEISQSREIGRLIQRTKRCRLPFAARSLWVRARLRCDTAVLSL